MRKEPKTIRYLVLLLACSVLLSGCMSKQVKDTGPTPLEEARDYMHEVAVQGDKKLTHTPAQPPADVEASLFPGLMQAPQPIPHQDEQLFDISVSNVPAREFFLGLVAGTDYNVVVHPDVSGEITLNLQRVTIPVVMQIAQDVYGYEYDKTDYGYQVLPARLRSRIFQVNYLNMQRGGTSQTRVSSGQVTQVPTDGGDSDDGTDDTGGAGQDGAVTGTEINTTQPLTTFWEEIRDSIRSILGDAPGRSVVVNQQSGIIVVRAMPQELREIEKFLNTTEDVANRQVILEAKILEVVLDDGYQAGINWSAVASSGNKSLTAAQVGGGNELAGVGDSSGRSPIAGNALNLQNAAFNTFAGATAAAFGGVFSLALEISNFTAFIEFLETQGNVQVLSSPRVATLNNQKAVIKVGTDEFFVTNISTTSTTGTAVTSTTPDVDLTPFFSGIALDVTPQISEQGDVILHVHPSVSEVTEKTKDISVGTGTSADTLTLPLALSTVRESDSVIRARSGQVVVIGGLMRSQIRRNSAAPPVMGDMLGHKRDSARKTELVILLKPIVVESPGTWNQMLQQTGKHLGNVNRTIKREK